MQKISLIILIIIDMLLSGLCWKMFKNQNQYIAAASQSDQTRKVEVLDNNFKVGMRNNNFLLDKTTIIYDLENKPFQLSEIIKNKPYLIIRFADTNCEECIRFLLLKVMRLYKDMDSNDQIILLASYQSIKTLSILIKSLNITYPVFLTNQFSNPCEKINFPYCFLLDSTMRTSHVFIPDKHEPQFANTYFEEIKKRYFENNYQ